MSRVVIFLKNNCPYCIKAKALFNEKNIDYKEINIDSDDKLRNELIERSNGRTTVPQIFIDDVHIGGCDDLYDFYQSGELDKMLSTDG